MSGAAIARDLGATLLTRDKALLDYGKQGAHERGGVLKGTLSAA